MPLDPYFVACLADRGPFITAALRLFEADQRNSMPASREADKIREDL